MRFRDVPIPNNQYHAIFLDIIGVGMSGVPADILRKFVNGALRYKSKS